VADRFAGALADAPYFGRYDRVTAAWRMALGSWTAAAHNDSAFSLAGGRYPGVHHILRQISSTESGNAQLEPLLLQQATSRSPERSP
jgi:hypothetical protein